MRTIAFLAALLPCAAVLGQPLGAAHEGFGHYHPPAQFSEQVSSTLYLPMRDGVRLAMRITRPGKDGHPAPGRFPVLWQHGLTVSEAADAGQQPPEAGLSHVPALTAYGYVVVQVARRGNGQSFGIRRGYNDRTEAADAYEVTEWLARQPWSTGRIGVYGCSNTGDAAMHALSARPPHLRAVFAGCFSWSKYDAMRRGGIFAQWGTGPQRALEEDLALTPVDGDADKTLLREAAQEHQKSTDLLALWRQLPYRDSWSPLVGSRFWAESSVSSYSQQLVQLGVPVYIMGGWHDELRDQGVIALLNIPQSRILIGPWKHCSNAGFELLQEIHRFFDTYLKGVDTGLAAEPRVHYFTVGGASSGEWHSARTWPVDAVRMERWYIDPAHSLSQSGSVFSSEAAFTVHTAVQCPDGGVGPFMQPCHLDGHGLSIHSSPLARDATITGNPVVRLVLTADRPDVNVFAYLEDVSSTGEVTVITEGRLKASLRAESPAPFTVPGTPWHRAYAADAAMLMPGEAVTLHFDLLPTSYVVRQGHRLQLTVTGSDYRERGRDPQLEGARIVLRSSAKNPAWLDVPVVSLP
jgi:predicted acyl esterase